MLGEHTAVHKYMPQYVPTDMDDAIDHDATHIYACTHAWHTSHRVQSAGCEARLARQDHSRAWPSRAKQTSSLSSLASSVTNSRCSAGSADPVRPLPRSEGRRAIPANWDGVSSQPYDMSRAYCVDAYSTRIDQIPAVWKGGRGVRLGTWAAGRILCSVSLFFFFSRSSLLALCVCRLAVVPCSRSGCL